MSLIDENKPVWSELKHVAWIRPGALGDLLVGLASLVETHTLFPNAKITVVGPRIWTDVLSPAEYPFVERIAAVERKKTFAQVYTPSGDAWTESGAPRELHEVLRDCDGAVNTNIDSLRYGFTLLRAGVRVRVGSAPALSSWVYTHASPYFGKDPLVHERDVPLMMLEYATPGAQKFLRSTAKNRTVLDDWIAKSSLVAKWRLQGLPAAKRADRARATELVGHPAQSYILVNPTASRREKTWPTDLLRALLLRVQPVLSARGLVPVVIGAPNETEWLREVAGDDFKIVQPLNLRDLQDIVASARALLTNGSSMQFIAGTTQTPTLTIFGRGQPVIWGPVGRYDRTVRAKFDEADQGSTFAGFATEVATYRTITIEEVERELLVLLAESPATKARD